MVDLDLSNSFSEEGNQKVAQSIKEFPQQISQAWEEASQTAFPENYKNINQVIVAGMGGSTLGADVLRSLFKDKLKVPLEIVNSYSLPASVDENTLVILASYSGTTEEVLVAAADALERKAKICGVTVGGELKEFLVENNCPVYFFDPKHNPSNQPRLGLGYTFIAMISFLKTLGLLEVEENEIKKAAAEVARFGEMLVPEFKTSGNPAKLVAKELLGKLIFIIAAEFLSGNAHVFSNQTNENSKNFAAFFLLSELNHHLLEGTTNPVEMKTDTKFIFLESELYSEKIKKRVEITKDVLEKQGINFTSYKLNGENKIHQAFEAIVFSSWVTFYLGILNGVDSVKIPWVDYFKEQLAK